MAREKSKVELYELLRRIRSGHNNSQIKRDTGTHRLVTRRFRETAQEQGWLDPESEMPSEKKIHEAYYGKSKSTEKHPLNAYRKDLEEYVRHGYTYVVMHELIKDRHDCSESTVRRYVQAHIENTETKAITQRQRELSIMEVDFGELGIVYDPMEKRNRKGYVFSGRLRFSAKAYRKVVFNQKQETFWQCHVEAFEYFGGIPLKVVPDNLKAAVVKASFTDPVINRGYRALAEHYNFLIDNCLPYSPQHKGGVESDIKYIKGNFWPVFKERQRQKGRDIPRAEEIQQALERWTMDTADVRKIKSVGASPDELFAHERDKLQSLPKERYDVPVWKTCKVSKASRISFDRSTYSVPEKYIGKTVITAGHSRKIRIYVDDELITEHIRAERPCEDIVKQEHLSYRAIAYMNYTKENVVRQARDAGTYTGKIVEAVISDRVVSGMSPARGILSLGKKYGNDRLEKACRRAWEYGAHNYKSVKRILAEGLDSREEKTAVENRGQLRFIFARPGSFFNKSSQKE